MLGLKTGCREKSGRTGDGGRCRLRTLPAEQREKAEAAEQGDGGLGDHDDGHIIAAGEAVGSEVRLIADLEG